MTARPRLRVLCRQCEDVIGLLESDTDETMLAGPCIPCQESSTDRWELVTAALALVSAALLARLAWGLLPVTFLRSALPSLFVPLAFVAGGLCVYCAIGGAW